jgi:hypothetical protein
MVAVRVMDKVKFALTMLSIAIVIVPIAGAVYIYRNNLEGLVLPPKFQNMINGAISGSKNPSSLANLQLPQAIGSPQYNPATGTFNYPFKVTNPLPTQIQLNQFSADVVSSNGTYLGNVGIQPITIASGANAIINVTGGLDQNTINQLASGGNLNVSLANVTVNIGGVTVHLSRISNIGSLPSQISKIGPLPTG